MEYTDASSDASDIAQVFERHIERRNHVVGKLRIGDLNKLYADRYRGTREGYEFPDDDAGREDLQILLEHYALNNPLAMANRAQSSTLQGENTWRAPTLHWRGMEAAPVAHH